MFKLDTDLEAVSKLCKAYQKVQNSLPVAPGFGPQNVEYECKITLLDHFVTKYTLCMAVDAYSKCSEAAEMSIVPGEVLAAKTIEDFRSS